MTASGVTIAERAADICLRHAIYARCDINDEIQGGRVGEGGRSQLRLCMEQDKRVEHNGRTGTGMGRGVPGRRWVGTHNSSARDIADSDRKRKFSFWESRLGRYGVVSCTATENQCVRPCVSMGWD